MGILLLLFPFAAAEPGAVERAMALYNRAQFDQAIEALKLEGSREPAVLALAGKCHFLSGRFRQATDLLEQAAKLEPNVADHRLWLGRAWGKRAETSSFVNAPRYAVRCRQSFEEAVRLDPKNIEAMSDLLEFYLQAPGFLGGGIDKANAMAKRIGELNRVEREFAEATLAEHRKDYAAAEKHFRQAAMLEPTDAGRRIDVAKFLARRGRFAESDAEFDAAGKAFPNTPKLLFERAQTYLASKRNTAEAKRLLERYVQSPLSPADPPRYEAERLLR